MSETDARTPLDLRAELVRRRNVLRERERRRREFWGADHSLHQTETGWISDRNEAKFCAALLAELDATRAEHEQVREVLADMWACVAQTENRTLSDVVELFAKSLEAALARRSGAK